MSTRETVIFLICGAGTLAMSTGAFGLLAAINRQSRGTRAVPLILLYAVGILLDIVALTLAGTWYLAAPMASDANQLFDTIVPLREKIPPVKASK